jgi:plasmid stability protein
MADIKVRNLDDRVADALRARASAKGTSLEQEVRDILTSAVGPDWEELYQMLLEVRSKTRPPSGVKPTSSVAIIRQLREEMG